MNDNKRVILIVLDSVGCGELPDADKFGDKGAHTLRSCSKSPYFSMENMRKMGYFNPEGVDVGPKELEPTGAFCKLGELSGGKDSTVGHWEMAGLVSKEPQPTYPNGFPDEVLKPFSEAVGRGVLCNKPYSGTEVIKDYGEEHIKTGDLIVYTSADSVFQIAAHEDIVPIDELYRICEIARAQLTGKHGVGRVIARPFIGEPGNFSRTDRRHDYTLEPPGKTMLDQLTEYGKTVISVGKIVDLFAGRGVTDFVRTKSNAEGIDRTVEMMDRDFDLLFTNLVDYDMLYGHRNDVDGYAKALTYFDERLREITRKLRDNDILMITADHGCDPGMKESTDHSREYIPLLLYGKNIEAGKDYGVRKTFADIGATVLNYIGVPQLEIGTPLF